MRLVANGLIVSGLLLCATVGVLYAYQLLESNRYTQESRERLDAFAQQVRETEQPKATDGGSIEDAEPAETAEQPVVQQTDGPTATSTPFGSSSSVAVLFPTPAPTPTAVPTPSPEMAKARRILILAIDVDSEVVEAEIKNGEWSVPKYVVGHLQGTGDPGRPGNAVYSGHIQSIASGNVFARFGELKLGDLIELQAASGRYSYEVQEIKVVSNTDLSVVANSDSSIVTLITCTGTWDFVQRDYLQRLIIVGRLL